MPDYIMPDADNFSIPTSMLIAQAIFLLSVD